MFKKQILVALLIVCLTITSCIGFAPQAFAGTADGVSQKTETPANESETTVEEDDREQVINGWHNQKYYVNGKLYTGVYNQYYFNRGVKITKHKNKVKKVSNGKFYCFKKDGSIFKGTGWKRFNGKRYYIKKGKVCTGWHYIGNYKYYFRKDNAALCQDLIALQGSKWKKKNLLIKVNRKKNCVTIYAKDGNKGYTIPVKALTCSVGKKKSPTIKGTYTLKAGSGLTYRWHTLGGPGISPYCYGQYCVRIHKSWLFHSVTYDEPDKMTLQAYTYNQLGTAASHGCVRLQVKDAKLIYDIVNNRNTKVKIYDSDYTGPFDKPIIKKIPKGQKYDPTDPLVKKQSYRDKGEKNNGQNKKSK